MAASTLFTQDLINWYSKVKRDLPWRKTKDPYFIWLSEIILQQTRVDQGLPYYESFVNKFETVHALASASEQEVMKTWEGLGYYSRARNLHATARYVSEELKGKFPNSYSGLIKLKGVGPYTAAAIASICFNEVTPVLDGNVFRFIARHFGLEKDIAEAKNRKFFIEILEDLIDHDQPDLFNQAMMEFGATVCAPKPICAECVFRTSCFAYENDKQTVLPVKSKKVKVKEQFIDYYIAQFDSLFLMKRRSENIWHGLYEFPSIIAGQTGTTNPWIKKYQSAKITQSSESIKHLLTHRRLWVRFHHVAVNSEEEFHELAKELNFNIYSREEVLSLPVPKVISNHLQRISF